MSKHMGKACGLAVEGASTSCARVATYTTKALITGAPMSTSFGFALVFTQAMRRLVHSVDAVFVSVSRQLWTLSTVPTITTTNSLNNYLGKAK